MYRLLTCAASGYGVVAVIKMLELRKEDARFFRTFASFMPQLDSYFQIEFDASLEGAGFVVSQWIGDHYIARRVIRIRYPIVDPKYLRVHSSNHGFGLRY